MSLSCRIERRCRHFIEACERERLHAALGIPVETDLPIEFLKIARTIKAHKPNIGRLIDVGAHVGSFARTMSKLWNFSEVVCVEPNRQLADVLKKSMPQETKVIEAALSNTRSEAAFYVHPNPSMNSLIPINPKAFGQQWPFHQADTIVTECVSTQTLDSLVDVLNDKTSKNILLKIDTQGSEMDILCSGRSVLALSSTCLIEYMFWSGYDKNYDLTDLVAFMKTEGFRCAGALEPRYRSDGRPAYADMLFLAD